MFFSPYHRSDRLPGPAEALPDRENAVSVTQRHFVHGRPLQEPMPVPVSVVVFGMGCFWGAERRMWQTPGVFSTAVGYAGGITANPSYEDVCSGGTGHAEVVLVFFEPDKLAFEDLLRVFWESHDPTQGMRQGNDRGTQYRSAIYTTSDAQLRVAGLLRSAYQERLTAAGLAEITTEIRPLDHFYYAEECHQQYLAKNPWGYCGIDGTGVCLVAAS